MAVFVKNFIIENIRHCEYITWLLPIISSSFLPALHSCKTFITHVVTSKTANFKSVYLQ